MSHLVAKFTLGLFALGAILAVSLQAQTAQILAFPNAEGFGRFASGGRGGDVYVVTNLNDSGTGSLRDGLVNRTSATPRTIVFAVGGTIQLNSTLRVTQGNLTIAGQTAPGQGICLARHPLDISGTSNVIVRFIRSRLGDVAGRENDAFFCQYATNVIIDHCSFSWGVDETASAYDNTNFTMQWCFVTESLRNSVHSKGAHGYGGIWGGMGASFHHNLLAHHDSRNPRFNGARYHQTANELVDHRNNVVYNWMGNSCYGGEPTDSHLPARHNVVNNYYRHGPATGTGAIRYRLLEPSPNSSNKYSLFHVAGNHAVASATVTTDNWSGGVQGVTATLLGQLRATTPFTAPPVVTQSAVNAMPLVLAYGGCRLPGRDSVDTRVANEVSTGTFTFRGSKDRYPGIIDSQADVGGWPVLVAGVAPADTDRDGMPDAWETARGLNPALASDRNLVVPATGYTRLEQYLNELAAPAFPLPAITVQPRSGIADEGASMSVSVTATAPADTGTLAYQWFFNGAPLGGATSSTLSIPVASDANSGVYRVDVTNSYGTVSSADAAISVMVAPPVITRQPVSLNLLLGQPLTLTVAASSSRALTYQWYRDGNAIPGATSATYRIGAAALEDTGAYTAVVSTATTPPSSTTSATANIAVNEPVAGRVFATDFTRDTLHAASPIVDATRTNWYVMASKTATASNVGDDPATAAVVEARPFTLALNSATTAGLYQAATIFSPGLPYSLATPGASIRAVVVFRPRNISTLGVGFFNSGGVAPHTTHISGASTLLGGAGDITGGVLGWLGYRGALFASGAAPADFAHRPAQTGAATTNRTQDLVTPGSSASYGTPPGVTVGTIVNTPATNLSFVDDATYTLVYDLVRSAGQAYTLKMRVYSGADVSAPGSLLFTSSATTTAEATLPGAVTSQFDSFAFGARTTAPSPLAAGTPASRLVLTSFAVEYQSPPPAVAPSFGAQPQGATVNQGARVTLSALASGVPAPVYQWQKNGEAIPGATSDTLVIASALPSDAGDYACVATNSAGNAVSSIASLVVNVPPAFALSPVGATLVRGQGFTLAASATGSPAPAYQWFKNGALIAGATSATYSVANAAVSDSGGYTVAATNAAGTVASEPASVAVLTPYQAWVADNDLSAAEGAPLADPAGDGVPNLLRFVLGGDPLTPGSTPLPALGAHGDGWRFVYQQKIHALADYVVVTEYSTDLVTWTPVVHGLAGVTITVLPADASTEVVTVAFPATSPRLFARLRASARL